MKNPWRPPRPHSRELIRTAVALLIAIAACGAGPSRARQPNIRSIGIIAALGDTCMFERVPDKPFEWLAPPEASFLEISDWRIDDHVTDAVAKLLGAHYQAQSIAIEHQDFDSWTYASLERHIRELALPEVPVDAYLLVLRDWRADEIGNSDHQVGGLGLYRRDLPDGGERLGVFGSYHLVLVDPNSGNVIASRPALAHDGRLPWVAASRSLWPRTQNDLTEAQHRELQRDFLNLIDSTLPRALHQLGLRQ